MARAASASAVHCVAVDACPILASAQEQLLRTYALDAPQFAATITEQLNDVLLNILCTPENKFDQSES